MARVDITVNCAICNWDKIEHLSVQEHVKSEKFPEEIRPKMIEKSYSCDLPFEKWLMRKFSNSNVMGAF